MDTSPRIPARLWLPALAVALLAAWIMYEAVPGINWGIWTLAASIGLLLVVQWRGGTAERPGVVMLITAVVLAAGAAVTASELIAVLICLSVMTLLALAMLLVLQSRFDVLTLLYFVWGPLVAAGNALAESFHRFGDLSRTIRSPRAQAVVRGTLITLPVVIVFALLLSNADPLFALWRENIARLIADWDFIPRVVFFLVMLVVVLGAYGYALRAPEYSRPLQRNPESQQRAALLGATERLILVSSVALLFWIFLAAQLSYLFGNAPTVPGSGITFADYARRGFGEITIVATLSVALIVFAEAYGETGPRAGFLRAITLALVAALMLLLFSAFRRVSLYEQAYGYTVARLYAQAYMIVMAVAIIALAREVSTRIDSGRLFRISFAAAVITFTVLVYWNHEGWIATQNIRRYATTGKLDDSYLTKDLSPNAIPSIVAALPTLPAPLAMTIRSSLAKRYGERRIIWTERWFEWNLGRARARKALRYVGIQPSVATVTRK
jgi:uncharacterized protein DUF4153